MTPERFARYDQALEREGFEGFLSANRPDIGYLTGSEDTSAILAYRPGRTPILVIREAGAQPARDSARAEIRSFSIEEGPLDAAVQAVRHLGVRRVAVDSYGTGEALMGVGGRLSGRTAGSLERGLTAALPDVQFALRPFPGPDLRRVKEPGEIAILQRAAACIEAGYKAMFAAIKAGVVDRVAAAVASSAARVAGAERINYLQLKAGPRSAYSDVGPVGRPFGVDEVGVVDMDIVHEAYYADCTRVFMIGDPPRDARRIVETVDSVQRRLTDMLKPGVYCAELYRESRRMFAEAGYSDAVPHYLGHGIGLNGDRWPILMPGCEEMIVEGEVICLEPGVYVPGVSGARMEDVVVVGAGGNKVLTASIDRVA